MQTGFGFDHSQLSAFSGHFVDFEKLRSSASGGGATALAEGFIENGGIVFGVGYTADFKGAEYYLIEKSEDLWKIKGSKYIESSKYVFEGGEYKSIYSTVEERLNKGEKVLFFGLGCTVAALYSTLKAKGTDTDNLYTVELVCHGPTSSNVLKQYVERLEKHYKSPVVDFTARYKKYGSEPRYIRAEFENGRVHEEEFLESDFGIAFRRYTLPRCFSCSFKGEGRKGDLAIGDHWGVNRKSETFNRYGVSLFITQTKKGSELLCQIDKACFKILPTDTETALKHNSMYYKTRTKNLDWDDFDRRFSKKGLHFAAVASYGKIKYYLRHNKVFYMLKALKNKR